MNDVNSIIDGIVLDVKQDIVNKLLFVRSRFQVYFQLEFTQSLEAQRMNIQNGYQTLLVKVQDQQIASSVAMSIELTLSGYSLAANFNYDVIDSLLSDAKLLIFQLFDQAKQRAMQYAFAEVF